MAIAGENRAFPFRCWVEVGEEVVGPKGFRVENGVPPTPLEAEVGGNRVYGDPEEPAPGVEEVGTSQGCLPISTGLS